VPVSIGESIPLKIIAVIAYAIPVIMSVITGRVSFLMVTAAIQIIEMTIVDVMLATGFPTISDIPMILISGLISATIASVMIKFRFKFPVFSGISNPSYL